MAHSTRIKGNGGLNSAPHPDDVCGGAKKARGTVSVGRRAPTGWLSVHITLSLGPPGSLSFVRARFITQDESRTKFTM